MHLTNHKQIFTFHVISDQVFVKMYYAMQHTLHVLNFKDYNEMLVNASVDKGTVFYYFLNLVVSTYNHVLDVDNHTNSFLLIEYDHSKVNHLYYSGFWIVNLICEDDVYG